MGLTMSEKRALTDQVVRRYRRAGKKEKGVILGEFVQTTGYRRKVRHPPARTYGAASAG